LVEFGVNINGNIAFYDGDTEKWGDWLAIEATGSRIKVKDQGPDAEEVCPMEKLEEMHKDLLDLRAEVLEGLLAGKKRTVKKLKRNNGQ
jgi:hypothetical protein